MIKAILAGVTVLAVAAIAMAAIPATLTAMGAGVVVLAVA